MKRTLKKVNQEFAKRGYSVELVKGDGYFYFVGKEAEKFPCTGVYVQRLNDLTLEQWMKEYESKLKALST